MALRRPQTPEELHEVLSSSVEELRRIAGIVADMLFLSHAERGARARRSRPINLAALTAEVFEYHEAALEQAELRAEVVGDTSACVDTGLFRRALSNLLANATRYAQRGSVNEVRISGHRHGEVPVSVSNHAPTIPAEHLPRLFEMFYRADPSRTQADRNDGLGLSIVVAMAMMHGGRAWAESGNGCTTVHFSIARVPAPSGS